jgi:hypothetical protein
MLLIQLTLAACAAIIMPLTTPMMLAENGGGEKIEKRFGNQNAGVAGHPFAHGAEDAGARCYLSS